MKWCLSRRTYLFLVVVTPTPGSCTFVSTVSRTAGSLSHSPGKPDVTFVFQEELCLLRTLQPGKNLIGAGYAM